MDDSNSTVYIGNLDERMSDRVLYDICIQAGQLVGLYIPRDKDTDKPKGFAFAQYETEEIANYAVKLFSGLVTLYGKTLKFRISGQDKPPLNSPAVNSSLKPRPQPSSHSETGVTPDPIKLSAPQRISEHEINYSEVRMSPGLSVQKPNGYRSNYSNYDFEHSYGYRSHCDYNYDYSRRVFGADLDNISRSRLARHTREYSNYYAPY